MTAWIKHPRPGTTVLPGRWLCAVKTKRTRAGVRVEILTLDPVFGWTTDDGKALEDSELVVAVSHVPSAPGWVA